MSKKSGRELGRGVASIRSTANRRLEFDLKAAASLQAVLGQGGLATAGQRIFQIFTSSIQTVFGIKKLNQRFIGCA